MKTLIIVGVGLAAATASAAKPIISQDDVKISLTSNHRVQVDYKLTGAPAVVTVEFQTNTLANGAGEWMRLSGELVQRVKGDVNRLVQPGDKSFLWDARHDWPSQYIGDGRLRATLTLWAASAPPTYLVCGLTADKAGYVRYYAAKDYIPGGFGSDRYKTEFLLMRKIPAAGVVWLMGSRDGESSRTEDEEQRHNVMLTRDYYMAVYETTQGQYKNLGKGLPGGIPDSDKADDKPVTCLSYVDVRGSSYESADVHAYCWPQDGHDVGPNSILGLLRQHVGLDDFDLPTEAEWEYACRAGESYMFYNGTSFEPRKIGWFKDDPSGDAVRSVGQKDANKWDLYDMQGNVSEPCLDHYMKGSDRAKTFAVGWERGVVTVDPKGAEAFMLNGSGKPMVVKRSGAYLWQWGYGRASSSYASGDWSYPSVYGGFRLVRPAVAK